MVTDQHTGSGQLAPFDQAAFTRRNLLTRIRLGHVVMALAALLALIFNVAVLRGNRATLEVAVAAVDIKAGTALSEQHIAIAEVPADVAFADQLVVADQLPAGLGQLTTRPIAAGSPLLAGDIRAAAGEGGLRAMSIPIARDQAVAGNIAIGDSVDVVLVVDGLASYVVTGVEVTDIPATAGNTLGATGGYAPTVSVNAEQALRIAAALDTGVVHLVRSTGSPAPTMDVARALFEQDGDG